MKIISSLVLTAGLFAFLLLTGCAWSASAPSAGSQAGPTLYKRLGGYDAIAAVSDDFIGRLAADKQLNRFLVKSGTVTIDNLDVTTGGGSGHGANDANDVFNVGLTVLDHATPSFAGVSETMTLIHDFGSVSQGDAAPMFNFDVFNFGTLPAFTADMDFDSFMASGDSSVLTTNLAAAAGSLTLDGGASQGFAATLDTTTPGEFSATYTLSFSDEDLAGALTKSLMLTLMGEITASSLAGDFNLDGSVDTADYTTWRDGLDSIYTPADYDVWKANFGQSIGGGAAGLDNSSAVPEPSTLLLGIAPGFTMLILLRVRQRHTKFMGTLSIRTAGGSPY